MLNISDTLKVWPLIDRAAGDVLRPITTPEQHENAMKLLEALWSEVGENLDHPLGSLFALTIERIQAYEDQAFPIDPSPPHRMLAFLMEQRDITQAELAAATGVDQSTISKLLREKRAFTTEQVASFSQYFRVSPEVFIRQVPT